MSSCTISALSYHHFPVFAFDHSRIFHPFCTRSAPFCTILPVLHGPRGGWLSVVAVSFQACIPARTGRAQVPYHVRGPIRGGDPSSGSCRHSNRVKEAIH